MNHQCPPLPEEKNRPYPSEFWDNEISHLQNHIDVLIDNLKFFEENLHKLNGYIDEQEQLIKMIKKNKETLKKFEKIIITSKIAAKEDLEDIKQQNIIVIFSIIFLIFINV